MIFFINIWLEQIDIQTQLLAYKPEVAIVIL